MLCHLKSLNQETPSSEHCCLHLFQDTSSEGNSVIKTFGYCNFSLESAQTLNESSKSSSSAIMRNAQTIYVA